VIEHASPRDTHRGPVEVGVFPMAMIRRGNDQLASERPRWLFTRWTGGRNSRWQQVLTIGAADLAASRKLSPAM